MSFVYQFRANPRLTYRHVLPASYSDEVEIKRGTCLRVRPTGYDQAPDDDIPVHAQWKVFVRDIRRFEGDVRTDRYSDSFGGHTTESPDQLARFVF